MSLDKTIVVGMTEGDICGRAGCVGIIQLHPVENCSCHINPPCSACLEPRGYCPICKWEEANDVVVDEMGPLHIDTDGLWYADKRQRVLDKTRIDYVTHPHTHFSMRIKGVYPPGTTKAEVLDKVKGTFGGRFEHFSQGTFEYIAYTD